MGTRLTPEAKRAADLARVRVLFATGAARAIRVAAGLSLTEFAAGADVDRTTCWRWENLKRRPRGDAALRALALLDELAR